jgi:hypothetical protein
MAMTLKEAVLFLESGNYDQQMLEQMTDLQLIRFAEHESDLANHMYDAWREEQPF